ncbi:hypothetical protein M9Y10_036105, partial [Tritrichomonas musculus]
NMLLKVLLSMKDYARVSVIKGASVEGNANPVTGGIVDRENYIFSTGESYIQFDFPEAPLLNDITFHLWDFDNDKRVYTYSIDVLSNGKWENVITNRRGQGVQYIHFQDMEKVTSIRMKGVNNKNPYLHLLNDWLSFRYTL